MINFIIKHAGTIISIIVANIISITSLILILKYLGLI